MNASNFFLHRLFNHHTARIRCAAALCLGSWLPASAAQEAVWEDRTYSPSVRTVQLFKTGFELAPPAIELNAGETITLRFDDLQPDNEHLSYSLVHCDHGWHDSDLMPGQYVEGTPTDLIPAGRQSFNTLQPFIQYELEFPNTMMRLTRSGNYILKVFRGSEEEDLVLTRRFLVYEQRVEIDARMMASRVVDLRDVAQQIDLVVRHPQLPVQDPFAEIHVALLQNMRWDDLRSGLKPRFMRGAELIYDFPEQGLFMGANEFRNFDLKDLRFTTQRVDRIVPGPGEGVYQAYLRPEPKRSYRVYFDQPDLNGRFFVRNDLFDGDPLGADYVMVHFVLPMSEQLAQPPYIYGAFSDWRCLPENRMEWDPATASYRAAILLKQGFYDFAYAVPTGDGRPADISLVEGSHYQTENDYLVLVYFTDRMLRCDRLVGVRFLNTRRG
jgi:hypothetical protein